MSRSRTDVDNLVCLSNRPHIVYNHYHRIFCINKPLQLHKEAVCV